MSDSLDSQEGIHDKVSTVGLVPDQGSGTLVSSFRCETLRRSLEILELLDVEKVDMSAVPSNEGVESPPALVLSPRGNLGDGAVAVAPLTSDAAHRYPLGESDDTEGSA